MIEIWRAVVGYEDLYEVSNWGRVKSLPRKTATGVLGGRILTPVLMNNGYLQVQLCKYGKIKQCRIHRLVAEAFIENPDNLPCVNHRDENRQNNHVENLEWCTYKYNNNYGTAREKMIKAQSKPVYQYTLDGEFVREWSSVKEVERQTGWRHGNIAACCRGEQKTSHGYIWSYIKV